MSGQNTLVVIAEDAQVQRPDHLYNWQFYRDTAIAGSGTYKAMDQNGFIEIIGGPGVIGGANVESGTFSRTAAQGSGVQNIPTTNMVKLVFFIALSQDLGSSGKDNLTDASATINNNTGLANDLSPSHAFSIVITPPDGWNARISAINANSYDVTWTMIGAGSNVSVQWHAIS